MRLSRTFSRLLIAGIATITLVAGTAGAAQAEDFYTTSGDFSWRSTGVERLANCAATQWYNNGQVGSDITNCTSAGSDPYWDGVHLKAAEYVELIGERVPYRSDQNCPAMHGFAYVKCYYVGGRSHGNPVMTIAVESYGYGGITARVSWYYL
ncbi:hypothetical protein O159_27450 [Leifsonia xyli subsp. cynodontis DSM 46306]|jgi:hypothetical protein|uniref:Secreted protein n=1 Tax=Leifsonia xyli subsp. cynodontis DSM 46306 TaxID=1389489 RepID=U3P9W5_LEIXC|nr:hypothetical protein [Leifsonia xyli]AGW42636.1 hypothetical protein O159_27450 [Leifsonia xyli subsp. cynodontis DSM 46306]